MPGALGVTVQVSGPLFTGAVGGRVRRMIRGAIEEIVDAGNERLEQVLRPRPAGVYKSISQGGTSVGTFRRSVHSGMQSDTLGRIFLQGPGAIYGPWLEGVSSRNQATRFKGYAMFRKTTQWLERERASAIFGTHVRRFAQGMS